MRGAHVEIPAVYGLYLATKGRLGNLDETALKAWRWTRTPLYGLGWCVYESSDSFCDDVRLEAE